MKMMSIMLKNAEEIERRYDMNNMKNSNKPSD